MRIVVFALAALSACFVQEVSGLVVGITPKKEVKVELSEDKQQAQLSRGEAALQQLKLKDPAFSAAVQKIYARADEISKEASKPGASVEAKQALGQVASDLQLIEENLHKHFDEQVRSLEDKQQHMSEAQKSSMRSLSKSEELHALAAKAEELHAIAAKKGASKEAKDAAAKAVKEFEAAEAKEAREGEAKGAGEPRSIQLKEETHVVDANEAAKQAVQTLLWKAEELADEARKPGASDAAKKAAAQAEKEYEEAQAKRLGRRF